jgi:hypothetical protein
MNHNRRKAISVDMNDEMANAREGVVYFWSQSSTISTLSLLSGFANSNRFAAGGRVLNTYGCVNYDDRSGFQKGAETASSFVQTMDLKNWCDKTVSWIFRIFGIKNLIDDSVAWISKYLLKSLSPFIGDIVGGVKGLYKFGKALVQKIGIWWKGRNVKLNEGHPQAIAKSIGKLINNAMLDGLYSLIKTAALASLKLITVGLSSVISLIIGLFEAIIKLIYTINEAEYINDFIDGCKEYWILPKGARIHALSNNAQHFNQMFIDVTENAPVIGAITLSTQIAGDKMRFLNMYTGKQVISEDQFKAGVSYLDALKSTGREYAKKWGSRLISQDAMVKGLLRIVEHGADAITPPKKAWYKFW